MLKEVKKDLKHRNKYNRMSNAEIMLIMIPVWVIEVRYDVRCNINYQKFVKAKWNVLICRNVDEIYFKLP